MKFKRLFSIIFGLIVFAAFVSIGFSFLIIENLKTLEDTSNARYLSYQTADELRQSSDDLTRFARTYVITGDERYKKMYEDVLAIRTGKKPRPVDYHLIYWDLVTNYGDKPTPDGKAVSLNDTMHRLNFSDTEFELLKESQQNSENLVNKEVAAFEALESGDRARAIQLMHDPSYHAEKARIMKPIGQFFHVLEDRTGDQAESAHHYVSVLVYILTAILIATVLLAIIGYVLIARKVVTPLGKFSDEIRKIDQHADLRVEVARKGQDEVAQMSQSLGKMLNKIRTLLIRISEVAESVNHSTERSTSLTSDTSQRMGRQAQELDSVATAVNEMSAALSEVAQNTNAASTVANDTFDHVSSSKVTAARSRQAMDSLLQQMTQTSETVSELDRNAQGIARVLDVIHEIAEQTNLLALNAAIEAARAGESGRGFAVVADEVRTLAQRTQQSTGEIESMITSLNQGMKQTIEAIEGGMENVNSSNEAVTETDAVLDTIKDSVNQIRDMNTQIAAATEEQSMVIETINRSVVEVRDLAEETNGLSQELQSQFADLSEMSRKMVKQVAVFKT